MSTRDKLRRKYEESHVGDESIGIDYNDLYGDDDDSGQESYHGVDDSAQRESAFDVDDSAFADEDEEFTFEELTDESEYDVYDDEESSVIEVDDSHDNYAPSEENEEPEEEDSRRAGDTLSSIMSSASGAFSKLSDKAKNSLAKKEKKNTNDDVEKLDSVFDITAEENDKNIRDFIKKSSKTDKERVKAAKDILEVLGIPETYSIDEQYYLPEDLKNIRFSYEAVKGFSTKEVTKYHNSVKRTIQHYVDLLHERNTHIVTLATEVDKKDDVIKKMQYDMEISEGVNVMPTQSDQNLENELIEARILISRLRSERDEALAKAEGSEEKIQKTVGLSEKERQEYNDLQDEYSSLIKEKEKLEKEVSKLKKNMLLMAEEYQADPSDILGQDEFESNTPVSQNEKILPKI